MKLATLMIATSTILVLGLSACELLGSPGGAPMLRKVHERLQDGDIAGAEAVASKYSPSGPNPSPYDRTAWCGRDAVKGRLNNAGHSAALRLIAARKAESPPLVTYALVRDGFDGALKSVDEGLETLCDQSPARISATDYDALRRPLADQMRGILAPLETTARAAASGDKFDEQVEGAVKAERDRSRKELEEQCKELREKAEQPSYEENPVVRQGEDAIRRACSFMSTYARQ